MTAIEVVKDTAEVVVKVCVIPHAQVVAKGPVRVVKENVGDARDVQGHAKVLVNSAVKVEININFNGYGKGHPISTRVFQELWQNDTAFYGGDVRERHSCFRKGIISYIHLQE